MGTYHWEATGICKHPFEICRMSKTPSKHMAMDQYLYISFLVGWTSIYQLFWGSLGTRVLTHPHMVYGCYQKTRSDVSKNDEIHQIPGWNSQRCGNIWRHRNPFEPTSGMDGLIFVDCIIIIVCHIQAMVKFWLEYIRIYIYACFFMFIIWHMKMHRCLCICMYVDIFVWMSKANTSCTMFIWILYIAKGNNNNKKTKQNIDVDVIIRSDNSNDTDNNDDHDNNNRDKNNDN